MEERTYIAIDLKSFYASVECVERHLNPLKTNLVVADVSRTDKTVCLAVTPSLKAYGIGGRSRLFEVKQAVEKINAARRAYGPLKGKSCFEDELKQDIHKELDFITAVPRMGLYIKYSTKIFNIYLKYVAASDMHVYSVDEVFMDVTKYLKLYGKTAEELTKTIVKDVLNQTGITATAGIGPNLYLCKIAMDIYAKHMKPDEDGVRVASLTEKSYRETMWTHKPITDFWRIGAGYAKRLADHGMYTMGDVAAMSVSNCKLLYDIFGVAAELLIDHAWGVEPCTIDDIKNYKPENTTLSMGQVLSEPYDYEKGKLIVKEMADLLALDLVSKRVKTESLVLTLCYDSKSLETVDYNGRIKKDRYGKNVPYPAHGTESLGYLTASCNAFVRAVSSLYDRITDKTLLIRRVYLATGPLVSDGTLVEIQQDLFTDSEERNKKEQKEERVQQASLELKKRFGKNAVLKGMNLLKGGKTIERNAQIGGHRE